MFKETRAYIKKKITKPLRRSDKDKTKKDVSSSTSQTKPEETSQVISNDKTKEALGPRGKENLRFNEEARNNWGQLDERNL